MTRTFPEVSQSLRMAGIQMPGRKDEATWEKAKQAAHKAYPDLTESNDRFWKITETIYESMGGK